MGKRIVIALGGNALGTTPDSQERAVEKVSQVIYGLIQDGYEIALSHGNGPQVGMINLAFAEGARLDSKISQMPLPECTAMSQGYIGYHLQKSLYNASELRGNACCVASVITQVEVDPEDPAFKDPTKPIGQYYDSADLSKVKKEHPTWVIVDDAGRGYRRVVPSPLPQRIVEVESILRLMSEGYTVISCGGGGIPVISLGDGNLHGVDAVIDKDLASELLAESINADTLLILTAVDHVKINYGKPDEKELMRLTVREAEGYCAEGHFAAGSMLPKVRAAISFARSSADRRAIIASLDKAAEALRGKSGTVIEAMPDGSRPLAGVVREK